MALPQVQRSDNLHSRVTRTLALHVIKAERIGKLAVFPSEAQLCQQLGVSRSILREAVKVLEDKGMIQVRPRSGTRARARADWNQLDPDIITWQAELGPDPHFLRYLCEVRLATEPVASGFAALRASEDEVKVIRECFQQRLETVAAKDLDAAVEADLRFHSAVIAASHNPLFQQLNASLHKPFHIALSYTLLLPKAVTLELEEYRKLTQAIEERNPLAARRAADEIVGLAMLAVEQVIRDRKPSGTKSARKGGKKKKKKKNKD
jgi:DNA-binding FadR family transcriptional regulator